MKARWVLMLLLLAGCGRTNPETEATRPAERVGPPPTMNAAAPLSPIGSPPSPQTKSFTPPAIPAVIKPGPPADVLLEPTKTLKLDIVKTTSISLSPDGTVVGISGRAKAMPNGDFFAAYYEFATGKRTGQILKMNGPGSMANAGKTTVYRDGNFGQKPDNLFVWELASGKQSLIASVKSYKELSRIPRMVRCSSSVGLPPCNSSKFQRA